jgi:hypothetical protein
MQGTPMRITSSADGLDVWFDYAGPWSCADDGSECSVEVHVDAHHPAIDEIESTLDPYKGQKVDVLGDKGKVSGEWTVANVARAGDDRVQVTLRRPDR